MIVKLQIQNFETILLIFKMLIEKNCIKFLGNIKLLYWCSKFFNLKLRQYEQRFRN